MDNRSHILARALQLFAARGYEAVGVQEIAEAAGVTKPTLYHYFHSKQGLLEALLEEHYGKLYEALCAAAAYEGDLPLTLYRLAQAAFRFARQQPAFYRLRLALYFAPPNSEPFQAVAGWNEKVYRQVEALFVRATEDHGNMRGRHQAYATTLIGMIDTYAGLALNGHIELNDELVYRAVHQFMHGIYS